MAETYASKNQEYWNKAAESVHRDKWVHDLQAQISGFLTSNIDWLSMQLPKDKNGESTARLMDYACGNGIVSRSLHPHFAQCIGVDLAEGMLAKYRATAADLGLDESRMMAVQGNLLLDSPTTTNPPLQDSQLRDFDLAAICMALHHVDDIHLATKRLAERLRPGGVLLVIDWAKRNTNATTTTTTTTSRDNSNAANQQQQSSGHHHHHHHKPHPAAHTISHDSFTEEQMLNLFQEAGCGQSSFVLADRLSDVPGARTGKMQLFFARATKL